MDATGLDPPLTIDRARDRIRDQCFRPSQADRVGLECEWHVFDRTDIRRVVPLDHVRALAAAVGPLPGGSRVTFEPGGQLELSTPPARGVDAASAAMAADHDVIAAALAAEGLGLVGMGVDPVRPPQRQLREGRYDAMEAFFDRDGPAGRRMMCRTAALQVNIDNGPADDTPPANRATDTNGDGHSIRHVVGEEDTAASRRWRIAHVVGPALAAAFATSPVAEGRPTGWASTRLATWSAIDPTRTSAVGGNGRGAWVSYALAANVMLVRRDGATAALDRRLPFADWVRRGQPFGPPTADDLDYHLTTLFPPVRPRGFLEIRYLDALPHPWWRVAASVVTALLWDHDAGERAARACAPVADSWCESARYGLAHPQLLGAARTTVAAARDAFDRIGVDPVVAEACDEYVARYLGRCRTPGDDVLDAWRTGEPLVAFADEEESWT
jgi:glutamate--cysteine ligase